jgi:GNAT superfamily N-acetyltransferase
MNKPLSSATASRRLNADLERLESGALVCTLSTGLSFDGPLREFFAAQPDRYEDLVSNTIVQVLPQLGWSFAGVPVCATLRDDGGKVCATGWAARTSFGSEGGVNLSYAVAPRWEGRGLGRYAVARALLCLDQLTARLHPAVEVHAQSLSTNSAAHAVALAIGLNADPRLNVTCRVRSGGRIQERGYQGSSAMWGSIRERARSIAEVFPLPLQVSGDSSEVATPAQRPALRPSA